MKNLSELLKDLHRLSKAIRQQTGLCVYPESVSVAEDTLFALARKETEKRLIIIFDNADKAADFKGSANKISIDGVQANIMVCPLTHHNASAVRRHLPFTKPVTLGVKKTIGTGDRLGIATPGHVLAVRKGTMRPVFCQQSIREMTRTGRTAQQIMDSACWGVLQAGWRDGFGADADHLKSTDDIDACFEEPFTFYTVDPGDYIEDTADIDSKDKLRAGFEALPWDVLQSSCDDCMTAYADKSFDIPGLSLTVTTEDLLRMAVKYGRAIAHISTAFNYLKSKFGNEKFEFEVSIDETATPTSAAQHYYLASELRRLGVEWVSLAPHFVGRFEKGVDYIGDPGEFRTEFAKHVAIARHFGPYKISLHSGSDKFSIYPVVAELAGELVHIKTAGTSYLEALRVIAETKPNLFREILAFARRQYVLDKATYYVSADVEKIPAPEDLKDRQLPAVLDEFDARQACHVTYGSVLTAKKTNGGFLFYDRIMKALQQNEHLYYKILEQHIGKHIIPFNSA